MVAAERRRAVLAAPDREPRRRWTSGAPQAVTEPQPADKGSSPWVWLGSAVLLSSPRSSVGLFLLRRSAAGGGQLTWPRRQTNRRLEPQAQPRRIRGVPHPPVDTGRSALGLHRRPDDDRVLAQLGQPREDDARRRVQRIHLDGAGGGDPRRTGSGRRHPHRVADPRPPDRHDRRDDGSGLRAAVARCAAAALRAVLPPAAPGLPGDVRIRAEFGDRTVRIAAGYRGSPGCGCCCCCVFALPTTFW